MSPRGVSSGCGKFLSTPSARRATCVQLLNQRIEVISIHALREEGDQKLRRDSSKRIFLSTPSARRATLVAQCILNAAEFLSTPSARRATWPIHFPTPTVFYFYPRPPRGGRPLPSMVFCTLCPFLSTPSARRATAMG